MLTSQGSHEVYFTAKEAARILRVRPATIQRYIRAGKLAAIKPGRHYLIRKSSLDAFLSDN